MFLSTEQFCLGNTLALGTSLFWFKNNIPRTISPVTISPEHPSQLRVQLRKHYFHQFNKYLARIPCINSASSWVKEALFSSAQSSIIKSSLYGSCFYFIKARIIFHQHHLFLARILCVHPTSISESTNLTILLFYPYLNVICYCPVEIVRELLTRGILSGRYCPDTVFLSLHMIVFVLFIMLPLVAIV